MSIDNQPLAIDTTTLPTNVAIVIYDLTAGAGKLEYNDRQRLLEKFIDIIPYAQFVNVWLTQASLITGTPNLTLQLAKRIKISLVDGIFNSKRQLPIAAVGNTWDASDQALMGMQASITGWDIAAAASQSDATLAANFNSTGIKVTLASGASTTAAAGGTTDSFTYLAGYANGAFFPATATFLTGVTGGGFTAQASFVANWNKQIGYAPTTGPAISWPPYNSTVNVQLSMANMRTLISTINSRRTSLQSVRQSKTNAINALTTIAAVIAYDATTGWPY